MLYSTGECSKKGPLFKTRIWATLLNNRFSTASGAVKEIGLAISDTAGIGDSSLEEFEAS